MDTFIIVPGAAERQGGVSPLKSIIRDKCSYREFRYGRDRGIHGMRLRRDGVALKVSVRGKKSGAQRQFDGATNVAETILDDRAYDREIERGLANAFQVQDDRILSSLVCVERNASITVLVGNPFQRALNRLEPSRPLRHQVAIIDHRRDLEFGNLPRVGRPDGFTRFEPRA